MVKRRRAGQPEMPADEVVAIVRLLGDHGIRVCVDGGWGVDALLGEQTRPHADLDIAVEHRDVPAIRRLLAERGYQEVLRADSWECNFVLGDQHGRLVDVHSYTFDDQGAVVFGVAYPRDSLDGSGAIGGMPVKCITAGWLVKFHSGYALDEKVAQDVRSLCQRFGIKIPEAFQEFASKKSGDCHLPGDCHPSIEQGDPIG